MRLLRLKKHFLKLTSIPFRALADLQSDHGPDEEGLSARHQ
jgi:hypothetical protein